MTSIIYSHNDEHNCEEIIYDKDHKYLIDIENIYKIINFKKKFIKQENEIYPFYTNTNNKHINLLEFLYEFTQNNSNYIFKNANICDLRKCNISIKHHYHDVIEKKYKIKQFIEGHYQTRGKSANTMKNPIWVVEENGKEILLMYCEKDTIIKLCKESYNKILDYEKTNNVKMTWFKLTNGYVNSSNNLFIHQIITGCYGNGKGTSNVSVDHIDRNPLNNTMENLRIATREEQEQNSKGIAPNTKRARQTNARPLPEGITQEMLKKYVVYYYNVIDKSKNKAREYFTIERHPKLLKRWETSKSNKISILEKLDQANKKLEELDSESNEITIYFPPPPATENIPK